MGKLATVIVLLAAALAVAGAARGDALAGKNLYDDLKHYAALGEHRFGSDADRATVDWIAGQLQQAGFDTHLQAFTLDRQYEVSSASIKVGDSILPVLPLWWPPIDKASMHLRAPIDAGSSPGRSRLTWVKLPLEAGAYLGDRQRAAIAAAAVHRPAAVLLTVASPGEEEYAFNVAQSDPPWPVPVIVVGSKHTEVLQEAQRSGQQIEIVVEGRYVSNVTGKNVVGRLDRGAAKTVVVSTPTTGWFGSACERGPGIAVFLALAREAPASHAPVNFVFVATSGHEVGHGGMEAFMRQGAPPPSATRGWIHLGASLACYPWHKAGSEWVASETADPRRYLLYSPAAASAASASFTAVEARHVLVEDQPVPGELRDVRAAGYARFLGMTGRHHFFHSPGDVIDTTGPDALEPVARAFARALILMSDDE